jgi:hypothetical protein
MFPSHSDRKAVVTWISALPSVCPSDVCNSFAEFAPESIFILLFPFVKPPWDDVFYGFWQLNHVKSPCHRRLVSPHDLFGYIFFNLHHLPWFSIMFHDFPSFSIIFHDFASFFHDFPWFSDLDSGLPILGLWELMGIANQLDEWSEARSVRWTRAPGRPIPGWGCWMGMAWKIQES